MVYEILPRALNSVIVQHVFVLFFSNFKCMNRGHGRFHKSYRCSNHFEYAGTPMTVKKPIGYDFTIHIVTIMYLFSHVCHRTNCMLYKRVILDPLLTFGYFTKCSPIGFTSHRRYLGTPTAWSCHPGRRMEKHLVTTNILLDTATAAGTQFGL